MEDIAIRAECLTKVYGQTQTQGKVVALNGVSVAFHRGQFAVIMGASGSGKSTLLHCLAGLEQPTSGRVIHGEVDLTKASDSELTRLRRDRIGFVFQSLNLVPTLTALENILLPLDLSGRVPDTAHFEELVDSLGISERLSHLPSQLSGGQQQRVAIARALVTKPDVLYADEPTGALDSTTAGQILAYLSAATARMGQTIIMVTHDESVAQYASRRVMMKDGHLVPEPG